MQLGVNAADVWWGPKFAALWRVQGPPKLKVVGLRVVLLSLHGAAVWAELPAWEVVSLLWVAYVVLLGKRAVLLRKVPRWCWQL